ncbi:DNA mismatch repair protein MutL [Methylobacterium sp. Leaf104]|uniref:DNA mismatch repair endonuclease MutL n=1 Tax=Methylobacterium TaxID=407 RepID=UPI0006FF63E5|nr:MULTISPECIES: DNA mismatch repair endonuclease MutL [Methylobacterium]KQP31708.1 DNA mismatch repair protein MutL [Methylobacterium sp. Leaf104]MCI9880619.1 DNA mismatch repair endonuclease MutL [Methylobacterium goesingense]
MSTPPRPVRRLDPILVDRIAAGEVVERPASAVKELVENAIDAGARSVEVSIEGGGRRLICVVDDGAGMSAADLALAVERHATSKLPGGDLTCIETLGFRGEALPSIGAVARLMLTSRTVDADMGVTLTVDAGVKGEVRPAPSAKGTRIEVCDLFAATPARLKFLKSDRAETAAISDILRRLAVAQPQIRFALRTENGTPLVFPAEADTGPAATLRRLTGIFGPDFGANALALDMAREGFALCGHIGLPSYHRGTANQIHFTVNGRPVRDRLLLGAVRGAYADTMSSDRHPVLALAIQCNPSLVDVNVHPAKTEVRFRDPGLVRSLVVSAIHETLHQAGLRGSTTGAARTLDVLRTTDLAIHSGASAYRSPMPSLPRSFASVAAPGQYRQAIPRPPVWSGMAEPSQARFDDELVVPSADSRPNLDPLEADGYRLGAARAQLHETYIVAQTADGLVLVDQHAAHERLVYERLKRERSRGGVARQGLLIPDVVEMAPGDAERLVAAAPDLDRLGLTLEAFGTGAVLVREVPAALATASIRSLVIDILDALNESGLEDESPDGTDEGGGPLGRRLDAILSRMSCHGSIRAGRRLRPEEMNALLREMETTPLAGTCNHGRPTFVELKLHDIERLFGRR